MRILIGTAGWADRGLIKSGWYPPGARTSGGRLRYYAERFSLVEVDSAYYAIPGVATVEGWVQNSPDDFVVDMKAYSLLTGHRTRTATLPADLRALNSGTWVDRDRAAPELMDAVWDRFHAAVAPLRESGRLGMVVLQFPPFYRPGDGGKAERRVEEALDRCAPLPVAVEFRHGSWLTDPHRDRVLATLRRHDAAYVVVDMPQQHAGAVPPLVEVTAGKAMIRLHGRSEVWAEGDKEDRYRYRYPVAELADWAARAQELARRVDEVHVVLNTCCDGAAQEAAAQLRDLLGGVPQGEGVAREP